MKENFLTSFLASRYFVALGVPLILLLLGAVAKKLVRATPWVRQDFYLGIDLALAGLSSGLIHVYEVFGHATAAAGVSQEYHAITATGFITVSLVGLLILMAIHQDQERKSDQPRKQFFWLGVFANVFGGSMLAGFILLVKGVAPV